MVTDFLVKGDPNAPHPAAAAGEEEQKEGGAGRAEPKPALLVVQADPATSPLTLISHARFVVEERRACWIADAATAAATVARNTALTNVAKATQDPLDGAGGDLGGDGRKGGANEGDEEGSMQTSPLDQPLRHIIFLIQLPPGIV